MITKDETNDKINDEINDEPTKMITQPGLSPRLWKSFRKAGYKTVLKSSILQ